MMPQSADQIVEDNFLIVRAKLLEIAATFDRVDRAIEDGGELGDLADHQRQKLHEAVNILLSSGPDRAERLQHLFSRPYDAAWRSEMQI